MPTPTIPAGNLYMNATLYTGTGANQTITNGVAGQSFQPDLLWGKSRSAATNNILANSVVGPTQYLISDTTNAEAAGGLLGLQSFNSNGFTVGTGSALNANAGTFVAWQWKAGGTAVTNTSGTISAQVSANTTSGFSIVTYTGNNTTTPSPMPTVGHGLGVAPAFIISKSRNNAGVDSGAWFVWTSALSTDSYLRLNTTAASASISGGGGGTMVAPTSSVFSTPYVSGANINANNYVAYCWTPIAGYSAFGSYTGNGSADGPFVYTGFQPRWLMIKVTNTTDNWYVIDTARQTYNVFGSELIPNSSGVEVSFTLGDIVSNGFKIRNSGSVMNGNGNTVIYAAFASNPFKYSNAF